jgi:hypothetical protein
MNKLASGGFLIGIIATQCEKQVPPSVGGDDYRNLIKVIAAQCDDWISLCDFRGDHRNLIRIIAAQCDETISLGGFRNDYRNLIELSLRSATNGFLCANSEAIIGI